MAIDRGELLVVKCTISINQSLQKQPMFAVDTCWVTSVMVKEWKQQWFGMRAVAITCNAFKNNFGPRC